MEDPSYSCLSTLRELDLSISALRGLDSRGLVACKGLEILYCDDCTVGARDGAQALMFQGNFEASYFPAAMATLTRLTYLELDIFFRGKGQTDIKFIYCLPTLQVLVLDNDRSCLIGADASRLSRLTRMDLGTSHGCIDDGDLAQCGFATNWSSLPGLKTLKIFESVIEAGDSLLGLIHLVHWTRIDVMGCQPADAASQAMLAQLLDAVSARRPPIALAVDMRLMHRFV